MPNDLAKLKRWLDRVARRYRAGELTAVRIPSEAEERVRNVVRCRETFQREMLESRHYILKFLACFRRAWCLHGRGRTP